MSDALCQAFQKSLKLSEPELDMTKLSTLEQAQVQQWKTLSQRFPAAFAELNDTLREETFLLGGFEASPLDAFVLSKAQPELEKLDKSRYAELRHIVRWALLIQDLVGAKVMSVDLDSPAERELPKKKEKKDAKEGDKKEGRKDKKDKKKGGEAAKDATAPAESSAAAAATGAAADGAKAAKAANKDGKKKEKKEKKVPAPAAPTRAVTPGMIDLRVGFIQKAIKHPDADSLYVSTIDVGEAEPRTICSGLVKFVPIEDMQQRRVVVVANLKPVKMRGILSNGMVLCASTPDHAQVEFVKVPEDAQPGDKIFFESFDEEPEAQLNPKKKIWEQIQPGFSTTEALDVVYKGEDGKEHKLVNKKGEVFTSSTIKHGTVS